MKKYLLLLLLLCYGLVAETLPTVTSLNGEWAYAPEYHPKPLGEAYHFDGSEKEMSLPNNWYLGGLNHSGVVWFEKRFTFYPNRYTPYHFLTFEGVDYLCDVWVNGHYAGSHTGYFQPFSFDISNLLRRGENRIKVRVNSPQESYPTHFSLHKVLLKGVFSHHDTRAGGAWSTLGQDRNSGGIWGDISIESHRRFRFSELKVTPTVASEGVWVDINLSLERLHQHNHTKVSLLEGSPYANDQWEIAFEPANFQGQSYRYKTAIQKGQSQTIRVFLKDAKLWYTHDRGRPHLYRLTMRLDDTEVSETVGFRSVTQNEQEQFLLNGIPLYLKGTNYISSQYLSEMDEAKLRYDLTLMREAHINTIRVHAHIESKRFYALCDEMGFLVWQDYNLQWGYLDHPQVLDEARRELKEMVDHLYNHPSIYLWSIHNEPPYDSEWMKWRYADYSATQNELFDQILYEELRGYDRFHLAKKLSSNNEHPWFGWYTGVYQDFRNPSRAKVVSEYGAQAIPSMASLQKIVPPKYLKPDSKKAKERWEYHNFQFDWSEKNGITYQGDVKKFIADSQGYQAALIKYATEHLRIQKYAGTTGIFQFMFVEGWPSMNWGVVDYYREKKAGYEALQKAFAPLLIVASRNEESMIEFYLINDTLERYPKALFEVKISPREEQEVWHHLSSRVDIPRDSVKKIGEIALEGEVSIDLKLTYDGGVVTNSYQFSEEKGVLDE